MNSKTLSSLKLLAVLFIIFSFTSCSVLKTKTAKVIDINSSGVFQRPVIVDLEIKETKVTGTFTGNEGTQISIIKINAIADALKNANADVLIEPVFETVIANGKKTVTVSGFPASYKNFRSMTVSDTVFLKMDVYKKVDTFESSVNNGNKKSNANIYIIKK